MHCTAFALAESGAPCQDLGQGRIRIDATRQHMSMAAVGCYGQIIYLQRRSSSDRDRFLTDAEMDGPGDQAALAQFQTTLLERPHKIHIFVEREQVLKRPGGIHGFTTSCCEVCVPATRST